MADIQTLSDEWQDGDRVTHPTEGMAIVRWTPDLSALTLIYAAGIQVSAATQEWFERQGWRRRS